MDKSNKVELERLTRHKYELIRDILTFLQQKLPDRVWKEFVLYRSFDSASKRRKEELCPEILKTLKDKVIPEGLKESKDTYLAALEDLEQTIDQEKMLSNEESIT